jgi:hypothetical protein
VIRRKQPSKYKSKNHFANSATISTRKSSSRTVSIFLYLKKGGGASRTHALGAMFVQGDPSHHSQREHRWYPIQGTLHTAPKNIFEKKNKLIIYKKEKKKIKCFLSVFFFAVQSWVNYAKHQPFLPDPLSSPGWLTLPHMPFQTQRSNFCTCKN